MRYAYFTGCVTPQRENAFELSTRKVLEKLGIELVELDGASCCGYFLESVDFIASSAMAARNLALAEDMGIDLITVCPTCSSHLKKTRERVLRSIKFREEISSMLMRVGRSLKGTSEAKHFTEVLIEDLGLERLKETIEKPLKGLRVAPHYGCHLLRPSDELSFADPENPSILDSLIEVTGAECVEYTEKRLCCGAPLMGVDEKISLRILEEKIRSIERVKADAIVTVCPFCHLHFDLNQSRFELSGVGTPQIPVLHYSQLLGLAQGFTDEDLALYENRTPADDILMKIQR